MAYRNHTSATGTDATAEGTVPAGTTSGDVMLAFLSSSSSSATITAVPTGWAILVGDPNPADFSCVCYWKLWAPGEPAPTWTWSASSNWVCDILTYSGVDTADPINITIGEQLAGANAITLGLITPTVNDCTLVGWAALDATGGARTWTQSDGPNERIDQTDNALHRSAADWLLVGGAGVAEQRTFTATGSTQDLAGFLIALAPVATGNNWVQTPADNLGLTDARIYNLGKIVADSLGITDTAVPGLVITRASGDNLGLTDAVAVEAVLTEAVIDALGLTDSVAIEKIGTIAVTDALGLADPVALVMAHAETPIDALGLTDSASVAGAHLYVSGVSANGRYFVDQNGAPILVRGESPWSMFTDLSPAQMDTYLGNRAGYGCNLALVSAVGSVANGGPNNNGATYDGILPFVSGNPVNFNETYWTRLDSYIAKARDLGITLMIYPMDGWNTAWASVVFNPGSISNTQCQTYGQNLATRYASYPNIIWSFGGDYQEDATINARFNACLTGIRAASDTRPCTIQLLYETSESHNSSFWEPKVDFDFVYTYYVTYKGMKDSYDHVWSASPITRPALFSEGAYENSGAPHFGTDSVIRRQACWALTSGSPGDFTGQLVVWDFQSGWETALDSTAAAQLQTIRDAFEGIAWWTLIPDDANQLVTAGRGTRITTDAEVFPFENNYVTAARSADSTLAVIYMPNAASAITVNMAQMGANPTATWADPTTGSTFTDTPDGSYSRGANAAGDSDWLLILTGDSATGDNWTRNSDDTLSLTDTVSIMPPPPPPVGWRKRIVIEIGG